MAKKLFLLHVGPDAVEVSTMTDALARGGIAVPDVDADTWTYAGLEIRRAHKAAGLKRKQVEGSWARVCRRAHKAKAHCFASMPAFFDATPEQAALALDGLASFRVVVVTTTGFPVQPPAAWVSLVRADRFHVLPDNLSAEQLAGQVTSIALMEEEARLDRRLEKVVKERTRLGRRYAA